MVRSRFEIALTGIALLASACGGDTKKKDTGVQFIAEDRFVIDPSLLREAQPPSWHLPWQDVKLAVRTAAALENNCPLEQTEVLVEMKTWTSPRIAVRVCGVERVYQQFDDLGYIDVSLAALAPPLPMGAASGTVVPDTAPAEPPPGDAPPETTPPSNPQPTETKP